MRVPITCAPSRPGAGEPQLSIPLVDCDRLCGWHQSRAACVERFGIVARGDDEWPIQHRRLTRASLAAAAVALAIALAGARVAGRSGAGKTGTAVAQARPAATATQAAVDGPPPTAADIAGFIRRRVRRSGDRVRRGEHPVVRQPGRAAGRAERLRQGDAERAGTRRAPDYWPIVLGDCYTVGDALGWLYQYTARKDFLYANLLMKRFNRAEVRAGGRRRGHGGRGLLEARDRKDLLADADQHADRRDAGAAWRDAGRALAGRSTMGGIGSQRSARG